MVNMLAIAAAAAWLLVFGWCAVLTSRPAGARAPRILARGWHRRGPRW
jgi:hypothetical protein